ncbi:hypothetical protein OC842_000883 [Tilletia horrida]|uniref:Integrase catalytic domain-containing protein n=1 Tax=Tilletia horrida TaxID=155126 RepID=A0AAN6GIW7_9BASI|nr:hypothetical protein OC842_000883 [Tilletia horrida]
MEQLQPPLSLSHDRLATLSACIIADLSQVCAEIEAFLAAPTLDAAGASLHFERIEEALRVLQANGDLLHPLELTRTKSRLLHLRSDLEEREARRPLPLPPQQFYHGKRGALTLMVNEDQLRDLTQLRLSDAEIGERLNCSRSTLKRRRAELGITKRQPSDLTHEQLCNASPKVREARRKGSGKQGERMLAGSMRADKVDVSRARLRLAIQDTDPFRHIVALRQPIQRREYKVPFVNSLWHLDGYHKLIRWRIVIHGAIDGKSRVVTFLKASSNNLASTVGALFEEATRRFSWPSRVRVDYGGENLVVKRLMEEKRGYGRGSFMQGSSVHNQRIERLWGILREQATCKYRELFEKMEADEDLDASNPIDLWTLHFVFLPVINAALEHFQASWNEHKLSTRGLQNKSPKEIFNLGVLDAQRAGWGILQGGEEGSGTGAALRDLAEFDAGRAWNAAERERRPEDPHVQIAALADEIPAILLDSTVQKELRNRLSPIWPPPEDEGVAVFREAMVLVKLLLRSPLNTSATIRH